MTELPFLVVHGALFWKLVLGWLVLVSCGGPLWWLHRHGRFLPRQLVVLPVAGLVWYGALRYAGTIALDHAGGSAASLDPRLVLAAGLPGSRTAALDRLKDSRVPKDEAGLELGLALDRFYDRCGDARLFQAARFAAALSYAGICGTLAHEIEILVALGRYTDAAELVDVDREPKRAAKVLIAAGRWHEAARAVAGAVPHDHLHACFARLLAGWGGDREARSSIARERGTDDCGIIGAIARGEQLDRLDDHTTLSALAPLIAPAVRHADAVMLLRDAPPALWLAPFTGDLEALAVVEMMRGRFAAAREALAGSRSTERELWAAVALRDGAALPPLTGELDDLSEKAELARRGSVAPVDEFDDGGLPAFTAAIHGDGAPLAALVSGDALSWDLRNREVLGVVPRVVVHRDALAEALRSFRADRTSWTVDPFDELARDASYRDTAQLIGDVGDAARWQTIIDRHAATLADRDRAIAMVIWQRLAR